VQENSERAPTGHLRLLSSIAIALVCVTAAYYSLRLGYAEYLFRSGRPGLMARAATLSPLEAEYQARLDRLERAVRLNPYLSAAWIELGMRAEAAGDFARSEVALREAARVDRTFDPRWILANYYFRRQNWDEFWQWIRSAAEMSYGDRSALFGLCWRATSDPEMILVRVIPPDRGILAAYVSYLARSEHLEAVPAAASRWLPLAAKEDVPALLELCDLLLEKTPDRPDALRIWNTLIERGWLPYQRLDPAAGASITNNSFRISPLSHGFDWRLPTAPGVRAVWTESPPGLNVTFDGHQEERTDILAEWMPVLASSAYELSTLGSAQDIAAGSGLRCKIVDAVSSVVLAEAKLDVPVAKLRFETPPQGSLVKLVLSYRRASGTNLIAGRLTLSSLALARLGRQHGSHDKHPNR
jgi:tetratricopeptide (TPR) repeat protein